MSVYDYELEHRIDELTRDNFWVTPNLRREQKRDIVREMDQDFHEEMCSGTSHHPDCEYGISGEPLMGRFAGMIRHEVRFAIH